MLSVLRVLHREAIHEWRKNDGPKSRTRGCSSATGIMHGQRKLLIRTASLLSSPRPSISDPSLVQMWV